MTRLWRVLLLVTSFVSVTYWGLGCAVIAEGTGFSDQEVFALPWYAAAHYVLGKLLAGFAAGFCLVEAAGLWRWRP